MGGRRLNSFRNGQSSMEYLLVIGFSMLFLMAVIVVAFSQTNSIRKDVSASQIQRVGSTIIDGIDGVYAAGYPSKKTIKVYFPDDVNSVSVNGSSIVFTLNGESGNYEYALSASTNLTGSIQPFQGLHKMTFTAGASSVDILDR